MMPSDGSTRSFLISEVQRFMERARNIRGVRRIALVGSLATANANPKDADLLIWIDDDAFQSAKCLACRTKSMSVV